METKQIIQTSANVIRITNLRKGDVYKRIVYKRIDDSSYGDKVHYGVVLNLYNNGEKTFIEALEYKAGYSDITAERKVISGTDDVAIFPASIAEIEENFSSAIQSIEKKIADKHEEIRKLEGALEAGRELASGEMQRKLSEPQFTEMTQREWIIEKQTKELAGAN